MKLSNVATYLDPYGYKAAGPSDWMLPPGKSPGAPTLKLAVNGHGEKSSHTFYALSCQLTAEAPGLSLEWLAQRRLAQLREELHDIVKSELGNEYGPVFSKAPFAKRGGPSGTTERLQKWLEALAACVNEGVAPPTLVAQVLRFLEAPPREQQEEQEHLQTGDVGLPGDAPAYLPETPTISPTAASRRSGESALEALQEEGGASPSAGSRPSPPRSEGTEPHHATAPKCQADGGALSPTGSLQRRTEVPESSAGSPSAAVIGSGASSTSATDAAPLAEPPSAAAAQAQRDEPADGHRAGAPSSSAPAAGRPLASLPVPESAPEVQAPAAAPATPKTSAARARSSSAEGEPPVGSDMVSLYLAPFGYLVANPEEWQQTPKRSFGTPTLALSVNGHEERDNHTYYDVHCWFVAKQPSLHIEWLAQRRLANLREELHDIVKNELGRSYNEVFAKAPFAKRGGFSGTTLRLQRWLEALATCVNDGTAPPALVAQVLLFLGAPAQTEHHTAASASSELPRGTRTYEPCERSQSRERSSSATRRWSRSGIRPLTLDSESGPSRPRVPLRREPVDKGGSSCDEAAEATTDDEAPSIWSPEKRRAGYEKLREWFKELRKRLEGRVKRQASSVSPRRLDN